MEDNITLQQGADSPLPYFIDKSYENIPQAELPNILESLDELYEITLAKVQVINDKETFSATEEEGLKSSRDEAMEELGKWLYGELKSRNLLTTKMFSAVEVSSKGKPGEGLVSTFAKTEYQTISEKLTRRIEVGEKNFLDVSGTTAFLEGREIEAMSPEQLRGAKAILDEIKMDFLSSPDNFKDKQKIKDLFENLDREGLVSPFIHSAYAQSSVDKLIRAMENLSSSLEKAEVNVEKKLGDGKDKSERFSRRLAGAMLTDSNPIVVILGGIVALGVGSVQLIARMGGAITSIGKRGMKSMQDPKENYRNYIVDKRNRTVSQGYEISPGKAYDRNARRAGLRSADAARAESHKLTQSQGNDLGKGVRR